MKDIIRTVGQKEKEDARMEKGKYIGGYFPRLVPPASIRLRICDTPKQGGISLSNLFLCVQLLTKRNTGDKIGGYKNNECRHLGARANSLPGCTGEPAPSTAELHLHPNIFGKRAGKMSCVCLIEISGNVMGLKKSVALLLLFLAGKA